MSSETIMVSQKIKVTEVRKIIVTETVEDGGAFVRAIRVYGEPGGTDAPPILDLVLQSDDATAIELTTPALTY